MIYSQILGQTERVMVGPMVTNPGTRDWTVTASLFATLDEMFGPRTVCGIGRGDSARRVQGEKPIGLADVSRSIEVIRALVRGEEIDVNGQLLELPWWNGTRNFEIWMAAYGPKALQVCGTVANGFILQLADVDVTKWMIAHVRDAAAAAGRDPASITICVAAPAYVGNDHEHMRAQCRWFGGMVGNHVAEIVSRYGGDGSSVPQALTDYIRDREGYDYSEHGRVGNTHAEFVPDEIVERFCILGPVDAHLERLRELRRSVSTSSPSTCSTTTRTGRSRRTAETSSRRSGLGDLGLPEVPAAVRSHEAVPRVLTSHDPGRVLLDRA